jgi:ABC-type transport system involved in multi-copper enzyme maturation permease subunit
MSGVLKIARLTFHEAWRRWVVLVALALSAVFLLLFAAGVAFMNEKANPGANAFIQRQMHNFLLLAGLYVVHFLTVMLSIFASVDAISGEIASHTIQTIATKPLRRWQIVLGKWLGYVGMIGIYICLLAAGILGIIYGLTGYAPSNILPALSLLVLEAIVLVSLSLLTSTHFSTLANGVALVLLYGLAFIGAWVEQVGSVLRAPAAVKVGIITSLVLPVEALWRRAAFLLQPPGISASRLSPFAAFSVPSVAMVIYAALYAVVALAAALLAFRRRDL